MKGQYEIVVSNNRLQYKFTINRNITIIQGNSATGKTTLIDLLQLRQNLGISSGITVKCEKEIYVLNQKDWQHNLSIQKESIIFIEEGNNFVFSKDFAREVKKGENYFVIVSRQEFPLLPYSVDEIYGIENVSKRYGNFKKVYNEFKRIYSNIKITSIQTPDLVIVEDSNSGFEFFKNYFEENGIKCLSANGNSNIAKTIIENHNECTLVIADGAAFGAYIRAIKEYELTKKIVLYLPESFEWLVLDSGIVKSAEIPKILENTSNYVEYKKYFSWEQFFTELLRKETEKTYLQYNKKVLNQAYLQENEKNLILKKTPLIGEKK